MCALKLSLMKKKSLPINTLGRLQGRPHHANLLRNEPFFYQLQLLLELQQE